MEKDGLNNDQNSQEISIEEKEDSWGSGEEEATEEDKDKESLDDFEKKMLKILNIFNNKT